MKSSQKTRSVKHNAKSRSSGEAHSGRLSTFSDPFGMTGRTGAFIPEQSALPFQDFSFGDLFSAYKKVGGLDGILSSMGKIQKMFSMFQPFFKLMGGVPTVKTSSYRKGTRRKRTIRKRRSYK